MLFASSSPADCVRLGETRNSSLIFMTPHYENLRAIGKAKRIFCRDCRLPFRSILLSSTLRVSLYDHSVLDVGRLPRRSLANVGWPFDVFRRHDRSDLF